ETGAKNRADEQEGWGWALGVSSALAIGIGTVLAAEGDHNDTDRKIINGSLPVVGAVLGYAAFAVLQRAKDASDLASAAATAMTLKTDEEAYEACAKGIATWN